MQSVGIRAHPLPFATVVFLASESMLFAALLAAYYYLRGAAAQWPPAGTELDASGMAVGTVLLGLGSITMAIAQAGAMKGKQRLARVMLALTIALAIGFLALEWHDWRSANFHITDTAYATVYYVLTGTHFAHVAVGVVLLTAVSIFLRAPAFTRAHHAGVEAVAYYWHFVFAVWLALYGTVFLVR